MCLIASDLYVLRWYTICLKWITSALKSHLSVSNRAVLKSHKGLLLGPVRKVARFRGPQSHIVWSSRCFFFSLWKLTGLSKNTYNYLTFSGLQVFHSIP